MKITLAAARVNAGLTQTQAGKKLGLSASTLANYENGVSYPDVLRAISMCELYGINLNDIEWRISGKSKVVAR